ncbi:MAG: NAD(P)/FAD-dependent oxidoreductase [Cyanobacteria bacterium P01_H01_bin.21]
MSWTKLARRTFLMLSGAASTVMLASQKGLKIIVNDLQAKSPSIEPGVNQSEPSRFDVIVIGGNFAGLSAAIQIARTRRQVLVIDAGKPRNRFAEASHGVLGHDGRSPEQIAQIGREQLLAYPTAHFVEGKAIRAERQQDESFWVELESGMRYWSQRIILAIGVVDHLPEIPGLAERWGKTVNQCPYCHGYELAGGSWGVLYTGEASLHQVKLILDWSDHVVLFSNGSDQISADIRTDLESYGITIENAPVESLVGEGDNLSGVKLKDRRTIPIKALFIVTQSSIASPLVSQLGCELEDEAFGPMIKTSNSKETTTAGVFAAGDVARPFASATLAAADGVLAGVFAHQSLVMGSNP